MKQVAIQTYIFIKQAQILVTNQEVVTHSVIFKVLLRKPEVSAPAHGLLAILLAAITFKVVSIGWEPLGI